MGEDVVLGSSAPMDGGGALIALDGPDIGRADVDIPDARLLFRALDNKVPGVSCTLKPVNVSQQG